MVVRARWCAVGWVALVGCGPTGGTSDDAAESTGTGTSTGASTTVTTTTTTTGATTIDPGTTASTSTTTTTGESDDEASSESTPPDVPACMPLCSGYGVLDCTDGEDNDGDGLVDLLDPECIGICDASESVFSRGIIKGNPNCNRDCQFDGGHGSGDDGCVYRLHCDPEGPGALIGCGYAPANCPDEPDPVDPQCVEVCQPLTRPGCDCFGCCTLPTDDGPVDVWIESSDDCSRDNLAACQPCTSRIEECGNVCTPETCEICIDGALPDGCRTNVCDAGTTCTSTDDCPCGEACTLGCCSPQR